MEGRWKAVDGRWTVGGRSVAGRWKVGGRFELLEQTLRYAWYACESVSIASIAFKPPCRCIAASFLATCCALRLAAILSAVFWRTSACMRRHALRRR